MENAVFPTNEITEFPYGKNKPQLVPNDTYKNNSRRILNSYVKTRNVRFLQEKLRQYICDTGLGKDIYLRKAL